jgi:hypothetical protein
VAILKESPFQKDWGQTSETLASFRMKNVSWTSRIQGRSTNHYTMPFGEKAMRQILVETANRGSMTPANLMTTE